MAWNEPGDNKGKDPWGGGDQGPPDLDEAFRKFKEKFGGNKNGGSGSSGSGGQMPEFNSGMVGGLLAVLVLVWAGFGLYTVDQQEQAVILRFGEAQTEVKTAGLHWNPPFIDEVIKVNVTKVRSEHVSGLMLTKDDNIVRVDLSVQFTVDDAKQFVLDVRDPEISLRHAAESALRHVVGSATLDEILTEGRGVIATDLQVRLQEYLNNYHTGIRVTTVNIEDAQPPNEVQAAFDDVIRAKEDEQRVKNEAEAYRNGIIPEARGYAQRQIEEASAYKEQVIAQAQGEAARFSQLLAEYEKAPRVTRERLYLDAMQSIMQNTSKVMVDVDGGNLMYLPLDQLMKGGANELPATPSNSFEYTPATGSNQKKQTSARQDSTREGR